MLITFRGPVSAKNFLLELEGEFRVNFLLLFSGELHKPLEQF